MKVTLSVIKADVGSYAGHNEAPGELLEACEQVLEKARTDKTLIDYYITRCGDDINLIMTHEKGVGNKDVHTIAWDAFQTATAKAKEMKLYGAGQDLLKDSFSGNTKGMGPGVAEMEFEERPAEPVIVFAADKTEPAAYSMPIFKTFADPMSCPGLVLDPVCSQGFTFEVHDIKDHKKVMMNAPEDTYSLLALIGNYSRYAIKHVYRRSDGEIAACISTDKLSHIAGKYVGKDDPVCIVRCQSGFPSVGEAIEPYAFPHLVSGWMRGSHRGPFMPCGEQDAIPTRLDGPPRVMALGFILNKGKLIGPKDLFADISYDRARDKANEIADYMRGHGPFQPHITSEEELEYTNLPKIIEKFGDKFEKLE